MFVCDSLHVLNVHLQASCFLFLPFTHPGPHSSLVMGLTFQLQLLPLQTGTSKFKNSRTWDTRSKTPSVIFEQSWYSIRGLFSPLPSPPLLPVSWTPAGSQQTCWKPVWVFRMCVRVVCIHTRMGGGEKLLRERRAGITKMQSKCSYLFVLQRSTYQHLIIWTGDWTPWLGPSFNTH